MGDIDAGFAAADLVIERTYCVPMCHQGYIEPHACVAQIDENGRVEIWCCTQGAFMVRTLTSAVTGIDVGKIKVTPSEIGGGFGGKTTIYIEPVATVLAQKSGRPVKIVMSREDVFRASGPVSSAETRVKIGVTKDGKITAIDTDIVMDSGAFSSSPIFPAVMFGSACYRCENIRSRGREVLTNKPKVYAYRAPGAPQPILAVECVVNEIAQQLNMDPSTSACSMPSTKAMCHCLVFPSRRSASRNVCRKRGSTPITGLFCRRIRDAAWAAAFWINAGMQSSATINVSEDGRVNVLTGNPDIGGSRASMALIAAEVLGVPMETIRPAVVDTDSIGYCDLTGGSRTTLATGGAVIKAAEALVEELKKRAAAIWALDIADIEWQDGRAMARSGTGLETLNDNRTTNDGTAASASAEKVLTLAEIAAKAGVTGGPLCAVASHNAHNSAPSFAVNICDAEVDRETGKVSILRYTCIQDAGKAVHPAYVEGQMQGGAVQGIGWALNEEYLFNEKGELENAGFLDYRIPVASDLPMIDTIIVEVPNPLHPYGIRGVGEVPICPPMPAVVTAVNQAAGIRVCDLPLSPPKILAAIDAA